MDYLVFGAAFFGIVMGGVVLAAVLMARALRADQRYLNEVEARAADTVTSEPAWVEGRESRQPPAAWKRCLKIWTRVRYVTTNATSTAKNNGGSGANPIA